MGYVITYLLLGLGTVLLSAILPLLYILRLESKENHDVGGKKKMALLETKRSRLLLSRWRSAALYFERNIGGV